MCGIYDKISFRGSKKTLKFISLPTLGFFVHYCNYWVTLPTKGLETNVVLSRKTWRGRL